MERMVGMVARHPRAVVAATLVVTLAGAWRATRLRLETDFAQLLPRTAPAVLALDELERRMPGLSSLDVVVEGPDGAANRRLRRRAGAAAARARRSAHRRRARRRRRGAALLRAQQAAATPSVADLERARAQLRDRIAKHKNPLYVSLDDDDDSSADDDAATARSPFARFPDGHFAYADGTALRRAHLAAQPAHRAPARRRHASRAFARRASPRTLARGRPRRASPATSSPPTRSARRSPAI